MSAWLKRFGLHLTAAIGATGIFVAAAAVGASQTRQQEAVIVAVPATVVRTRVPVQGKPTAVVATPTSAPPASAAAAQVGATPTPVDAPGAAPGQGQPTTPTTPTATPQTPPTALPKPAPTKQRPAPQQPAPQQPTAQQPVVQQPVAQQAPPPEAAPGPDQQLPQDQQPVATGVPQAPGAPNQSAPRPTPHSTAAPRPSPTTAPAGQKVVPERSLSGTIKEVLPDAVLVVGTGGREWRIAPAPGALIRLNGKAARLDTLQAGDSVVVLGQAQSSQEPVGRFLAHAITVRRK